MNGREKTQQTIVTSRKLELELWRIVSPRYATLFYRRYKWSHAISKDQRYFLFDFEVGYILD